MVNPKIRMRVNKDKYTRCSSCNVKWKNTSEMYDLKIGNNLFSLCKHCTNELFVKTLKAANIYNARIKDQQDLRRIQNEHEFLYGSIGKYPSEVLNGNSEEEE